MSRFGNNRFMPLDNNNNNNNQRNVYQPPGKRRQENNKPYNAENNRFLNPRSRRFDKGETTNNNYNKNNKSYNKEQHQQHNRRSNFNQRNHFSKETKQQNQQNQHEFIIDTMSMQEFPGLNSNHIIKPQHTNIQHNYSNAANLSFRKAFDNSSNKSKPQPEKPKRFVSLVSKKKKVFTEEEEYEIDIEVEKNYLETTYFSDEEEKPDNFNEDYWRN